MLAIPHARAHGAFVALLALAMACPGVSRAAPAVPDSATAPRRSGARDAALAAGFVVLEAVTAAHDRAWSDALSRDRSLAAGGLATLGRQLGDPVNDAAALLSADALARLAGRTAFAEATERVALATAGAAVLTLAIKTAAGRDRPDVAPGDPHRFRPFTSDDALPSAHATLAFAIATAASVEAHSPWVPVVLYPAAALTAWSRVHERRHWPSDVVAGAAVGTGVAATVDRLARRRLPHGLLVLVWPRARGAGAAAGVRF